MTKGTRWALVLLLAGAATDMGDLSAQATELPGDVTEVLDRTVRIRMGGELLPRVGDVVRIRFRDPVPGVGLTFLRGTWRVSEVRADYVSAVPAEEGAEPQIGQVAVISSHSPQERSAVEAAVPADAKGPAGGEVAAVARERGTGKTVTIDRRRWISISAGSRLVGMNNPVFRNFETEQTYRPGLTAAAGIHVLSRLAVGGYLGMVGAEGTNPDGLTQSVEEIYKGLGATLYVGTPGNVAGDLFGFVQGARVWYDIHYGGAGGDPEATGTGTMAGAGLILTLRRSLGAYVAGHWFTSEFDEPGIFHRSQLEMSAGLTVIH